MLEVMVRGTIVTTVLIVTLFTVTPARAAGDDPSPADVNAARELGKEGMKLADQGKCEQAIEKLSRAEKLFHAPTILARLGECPLKTAKLVAETRGVPRATR